MVAKNHRSRSASASRAARSRRFTAAVDVAALEPRLLLTAVPTTTTLAASKVAATAGQPVILTATVVDGPGNPTPTGGTVTFLDGSNVLGTATLANGSAQITTSTLPVGTHKVSASYGGDGANFLGSSSLVATTGPVPVVAGNLFFGDGAPAVSALLNNPTAVAVDSAGNVYVADTFHEVIRKVGADGKISTVTGQYLSGGYSGDGGPAASAQVALPAGLAVNAAGDLFIADFGNNAVREIHAGTISTVATGLNKPMGLAIDSSGNLYIADSGDDVVRKLSGGVLTVVAGTLGSPGSTGDGGPATSATLNNPTAVAVDSAGDLFIADTGNNVVRVVIGTTISTAATGLNGPEGVAVDPAGLFVADSGNHVIKKFLSGTTTTVATGLNRPQGLAVDAAGHVFIADRGNNVVRELNGATLTIVAGTTDPGRAGDAGPATSAELRGPLGVALDAAGDLFIVDSTDSVVRKVTAGGTISTYAGTGIAGFSGDGGPATSAALYAPQGVAVDAAGNLYIAELNNSIVRKVTPAGVISTVAGVAGNFGSIGDGGPATAAELRNPTGVAVDSLGNIYIADMNNNEIRQVTPGGTISDFAGSPSGAAGGTHSVALAHPTGVAVDAAGDVFIADTGNNRIVEVKKSDGSVVVVAGTGAAGNSGDGGPATSALLNAPTAVSVDPFGDLLIVDGSTNGLRLVTPTGLITTVLSGAVPGPGRAISEFAPRGAVADAAGDVFVSDFFSGVVRKESLHPLTIAVAPAGGPAATTTIALPSTSTPVRGQAVTVYGIVSANPAGATPPTGTITFKIGTFTLATVPLVTANGHTYAPWTSNPLTMGTYTITTSYSGDASDQASTGSTTFVVGPDHTFMSAVPSVANPVRGQVETLYALVSPVAPGTGAVTGTISFKFGSSVLATAPIRYLNGQAYATMTTAPLGLGTYNFTTVYNGDAGDLPSSTPLSFTVGPDATTILAAASTQTPVRGQPVTLYALISPNPPGVGKPTGVVAFDDGSTVLGFATVTTIAGQQWATLNTSSLAVGSHSIRAIYSGDAGDKMSVSAAIGVIVGKDATTTTGFPSAASAVSGQQVVLYGVVKPTAPGAGAATGLVNFVENGKTVGAGFLGTANGQTYTYFITSTLSVGTHTFTAVYQGDGSDQGSTSAPFTVRITAASGTGSARLGAALVASPSSPTPPAQAPSITPAARPALATASPSPSPTVLAAEQEQAWAAALEALVGERPTKVV